jgi:regulatory protein
LAGPALSLKARALRCLAQREHSRAELARKLVRHAEDRPEAPAASQIETLLDELAAQGLLDEQRAAQAVVRVQSRRFGAARVRQTLRDRGVPPEVAADALAALDGSELERAREVWRRRFGAAAGDAAGRAKQARFLAGRGFGADVIRRVVRGIDDEPD